MPQQDGSPKAKKTGPSIDALMREYLASLPGQKRRRRDGGPVDSLQLFQHALEGYGYQYLSRADSDRYFLARDEQELADAIEPFDEAGAGVDDDRSGPNELEPPGAFCRLFGVGPMLKYLDEFLDYFMIRKVLFPEDLVVSTIADVNGFFTWLSDNRHLTRTQTRASLGRLARAIDEVPTAERLSRILYEESRRSEALADRLRDSEIVEDFLVVERVAPGRIWLIGVDGPLKVPEAASRLARPGWTINLVIGRIDDVWRVLEVGNVYPETLA